MSAETLEVVAPYLAGPGAAVFVLLFVLFGAGWVLVKQVIPLISKFGERHLEQIDRLISNQQDEARTIARALSTIDMRLVLLEQRLAPEKEQKP